jgi:3-polyprenyl-4-hydroxybenzoate decarboxylase
MSGERARSVAIAITGASGALYAVRTLAALDLSLIHNSEPTRHQSNSDYVLVW